VTTDVSNESVAFIIDGEVGKEGRPWGLKKKARSKRRETPEDATSNERRSKWRFKPLTKPENRRISVCF
jgi:hypothetical protein